MSASGQIVAEHDYPVQAATWTEAGGWRVLGSPYAMGCLDTATSSISDVAGAWDISADGRFIVGLAYDGCIPAAFLWTDDGSSAGVFTPLEVLGVPFDTQPAPPNRATVISDNGQVIAGWAANGPVDRSPAIWRADGSGFLLDPNDMDAPGEILSISPMVAWSPASGRSKVSCGRNPKGASRSGACRTRCPSTEFIQMRWPQMVSCRSAPTEILPSCGRALTEFGR